MPTEMPKPAAILARCVVLAQERALVRWELAATVTLKGDDDHGGPLDQRMRQVECGRIRDQRGTQAVELTLRRPPSAARVPGALRFHGRHPIDGLTESAHGPATVAGPGEGRHQGHQGGARDTGPATRDERATLARWSG